MLALTLLLACGGEVKDTPDERPDLSDASADGTDGGTDGGTTDGGTTDGGSTGGTTDGGTTGDTADPGADNSGTGAGQGEPDPSEYIYEEDDTSDEVLLSLGELEEGMLSVFETMTWMDPALFFDTFDELQHQGDDTCPLYYYTIDEDGVDYWYDYCTATTGMSFYGYYYGYIYEPYDSGPYTYHQNAYYQGDAKLIDADGNSMEASGYAYHSDYDSATNNTRYSYAYFYGDFRWDGPGSDGTWLSAEIAAAMDVYATYNRDNGGRYFGFNGSFSGAGEPVDSVYMDQFVLFDEHNGSDCPIEPAGTASLRDVEGNWYDVDFQGSPYWGASVFPLDCDGCGQVYHRGEYLGDVCPDFSPLVNWAIRPW